MIEIEVEIEEADWRQALPEAEAVATAAARAALGAEGGALAVLLTSDQRLAALNQQFRGRTGPTNVLSFPAAPSASPHLGDLALAFGVCRREAREQGKSLGDHLSHLIVHGVLHLLGEDHLVEDEAERMEQAERDILRTLGVADPYLSPAGESAEAFGRRR